MTGLAWHVASPELLHQLKEEVRARYQTLRVQVEGGVVFVRGSFAVEHEGKILDRYSIEVELPGDYPESIPVLREVGGRIPWFEACHVNRDGVACPFLPDERWRVYPRGSTLLEYFDGPVRNYFLGQSLVQLGKPWPFGERKHGLDGVIEYYMELFKTGDLKVMMAYLRCLSKAILKGHWDCPCGSGKRIRHCHFVKLQVLKSRIPPSLAAERYKEIQEALAKIRRTGAPSES